MGAPGENETNLQLVLTKAAFARGRKPPELPWKCSSALLGQGEEPGEVCGLSVQSWRSCPGLGGWWSHSRPARAWICSPGAGLMSHHPELSPNPKAPGMTLYHWALMINQPANYHSQSRLLGAFLSGRAKAGKGDLVFSKHELFPTLPATRWHWRRFWCSRVGERLLCVIVVWWPMTKVFQKRWIWI